MTKKFLDKLKKNGVIYLSETKYITGVVIANGIPDSDGDVLTKKDIKIISTKYRDRLTDVMHSRIKNEGVDVIHDWISETETRIDGQLVPAGSWLADFAVSNTEILKAIDENELRGLSLGSVSEDALTRKTWFINKRMTYSDLKSMEEVIPLFISFVDKPANGFTFEVNEYEVFINKQAADVGDNEANERDTMSNEEKVEINKTEEAMVPTSFVEKLLDKLTINKAEEEVIAEEPVVEEPATEVDESAEDLATQLLSKFDAILANQEKIIEQNDAILAGLNKEEAAEEEEEIEKAEEEEEEEVVEETVETDEEEEIVEKAEEEETTEEETSEEEDEEDGINKRETGMPADINKNQAPKKTFYQRTGRDALGRKLKH